MSGLFLLRRSRKISTSHYVTKHCFDEPIGAACETWKSRVTQCGTPRTPHRGPFATALSNFLNPHIPCGISLSSYSSVCAPVRMNTPAFGRRLLGSTHARANSATTLADYSLSYPPNIWCGAIQRLAPMLRAKVRPAWRDEQLLPCRSPVH